jgi:glyoxylase-like metal-dependent hydrolase (beta-lactamase superfamily II)
VSEHSYTGAVHVGGPADVRRLPGLTIAKLAVGKMSNNAYLLRDVATGAGLLIDAAAEPENLLELTRVDVGPDIALEDTEGPGDRTGIQTIVTTHQHFDHVGALVELVAATGAATAAGALDADALPAPVDRRLEHGDRIALGESELEVIHLRGHTPGSVALLYRDPQGHGHLFTGDSLFPGGVGKTMTPENFTSLIDDVETRIFGELGDDTWFYPGHGDDSTLGEQRAGLPEWRERGW